MMRTLNFENIGDIQMIRLAVEKTLDCTLARVEENGNHREAVDNAKKAFLILQYSINEQESLKCFHMTGEQIASYFEDSEQLAKMGASN